MDKQTFILSHATARERALEAVKTAQDRFVVTIRPPTRTLEQNALLWALLADVSEQVWWHGEALTPTDWKHVLTAALTEQRTVPGINGGLVVLGKSTSEMTKAELSELIELIYAFGTERDVVWSNRE